MGESFLLAKSVETDQGPAKYPGELAGLFPKPGFIHAKNLLVFSDLNPPGDEDHAAPKARRSVGEAGPIVDGDHHPGGRNGFQAGDPLAIEEHAIAAGELLQVAFCYFFDFATVGHDVGQLSQGLGQGEPLAE